VNVNIKADNLDDELQKIKCLAKAGKFVDMLITTPPTHPIWC